MKIILDPTTNLLQIIYAVDFDGDWSTSFNLVRLMGVINCTYDADLLSDAKFEAERRNDKILIKLSHKYSVSYMHSKYTVWSSFQDNFYDQVQDLDSPDHINTRFGISIPYTIQSTPFLQWHSNTRVVFHNTTYCMSPPLVYDASHNIINLPDHIAQRTVGTTRINEYISYKFITPEIKNLYKDPTMKSSVFLEYYKYYRINTVYRDTTLDGINMTLSDKQSIYIGQSSPNSTYLCVSDLYIDKAFGYDLSTSIAA